MMLMAISLLKTGNAFGHEERLPLPLIAGVPITGVPQGDLATRNLPKAGIAKQEGALSRSEVVKPLREIDDHFTMMFTADEMEILNQRFKEPDKKPVAKQEGTVAVSAPAATENPLSFFRCYLGTILYYKRASWSVWIDRKKITSAHPDISSELKILSVSPERVTIEWLPRNLDVFNQYWEQHSNALPQDPRIRKTATGFVFSLRPNQTFLNRTLSIREGDIPTSY